VSLGHILGIHVRINPFFIIVLCVYAALGLLPSVLVYFFLIVTHELAHVVFAAGLGLRIDELELLPFGSVARIPDLGRAAPSVETTVALAGPMHNFLLLAVGLVVAQAIPGPMPEFLAVFVTGNLVLGLFNMLPVLPLDGGRVLRAQLCSRLGYRRATMMLARAGWGIAACLLFAAGVLLYSGNQLAPTMAVVSLFLCYAAARETTVVGVGPAYHIIQKHERLQKGQALAVRGIVVDSELTLAETLQELSGEYYHVIWVVEPTRGLLGYIPETELVGAAERLDVNISLAEFLDVM